MCPQCAGGVYVFQTCGIPLVCPPLGTVGEVGGNRTWVTIVAHAIIPLGPIMRRGHMDPLGPHPHQVFSTPEFGARARKAHAVFTALSTHRLISMTDRSHCAAIELTQKLTVFT